VPPLLPDIVIIFALAVGAALVCHRLKIPTIIGLLLAGVLAGPSALGLVRNLHDIALLAEIGVVLLLFVIGLEFNLADIAKLRRHFVVGGTLQFFGTCALFWAGGVWLGLDPLQSLFLGFVAANSSTAIAIKLLQERAELESPHGRSVLAILIYQDIGIVPVLLIAPLLAGNLGDAGWVDGAALVGRVALLGLLVAAGMRWIVPWLLERITATKSSEAFLLTVVALCMGIALLTQSAGLSLALGAFLAGLIISDSDYSHQAVAVVLPFRDIFISLFFVSTGMLLDLGFLFANPLLIGLLTLAVLVLKSLAATGAVLAIGLPLRNAVLGGMIFGQVGEFSLVAAQAGVAAGLLLPDHFQIVLNVAVLSMLAAPGMMSLGHWLADRIAQSRLGQVRISTLPSRDEASDCPAQGHVMIVGFGVTGRNLAKTARLAALPYAIIELNSGAVRTAREAGEPIFYGDATQQSNLERMNVSRTRAVVVVIDDPAGARRIVEIVRRMAPETYLLVRSRYLSEVEALLALGADEVIADELEVSIEVFSRVLTRMLVPREDIKRLIGGVRGDWRRMARSFSREATSMPVHRVDIPHLLTHTLRLGETSPIAGRTIATSGLRADHGVTVLAVTREDTTHGNPSGEFRLQVGDVLFVIGPDDWDPRTVT
jgi:monovalent cation:H+ antiporter-2, CPA2 family